ncbi:MAG: hypothetical protein PHX74_01935 [Candidatus Sumerlaeales bacterium]|nr:hypothetical protein [Candidatus Sumerlaeales bacterium]
MKIWLAVTPDKYEYFIAIEPTCTELTKIMGVSVPTISRKYTEGNVNRFGVRVVEIKEGGK